LENIGRQYLIETWSFIRIFTQHSLNEFSEF
jgi:hypothetical protein